MDMYHIVFSKGAGKRRKKLELTAAIPFAWSVGTYFSLTPLYSAGRSDFFIWLLERL